MGLNRRGSHRKAKCEPKQRQRVMEGVRAGDEPVPRWPQVSFVSCCICQKETQEWLASAAPLHCSCVGCLINDESDAFPFTGLSSIWDGYDGMQKDCTTAFSFSQLCNRMCSLSHSTRWREIEIIPKVSLETEIPPCCLISGKHAWKILVAAFRNRVWRYIVRNVRGTGSGAAVKSAVSKRRQSRVKYLSAETILRDSLVVVGVISDWSIGDHPGISSIRPEEQSFQWFHSSPKVKIRP